MHPAPGRSRPCRDSGSAALELTLLTPILFAAVVMAVQLALGYHARHLLQAAAQEGARVARADGGTEIAARERSLAFLTAAGGRVVAAPDVTVEISPTTARVTVTGRVLTVLPGVTIRASATSTGPRERFVP
jgi:Flp pilus assembly protein TadG